MHSVCGVFMHSMHGPCIQLQKKSMNYTSISYSVTLSPIILSPAYLIRRAGTGRLVISDGLDPEVCLPCSMKHRSLSVKDKSGV